MDLGSIFIGLAIAIIAVVYVTRPIFAHQGRAVTVEDRRISELKANRDRIIRSIQDLEMDYAMGKIPDGDYRIQRDELMAAGAVTLREIDDLGGGEDGSPGRDIDAEIESAVARLRGGEPSSAGGLCPGCGKPVAPGDLFCTHCGGSLGGGEAGA
jgi:hypothetical protein